MNQKKLIKHKGIDYEKIKKIFASFIALIIGYTAKVFAVDPRGIQTKYGVFVEEPPTISEKNFDFLKIAAPLLLFVIGIVVILNEKLSNIAKAIVVICLLVSGILLYNIF